MFVSQIDSVPSLSAAIQARREARGLSQAELARMAGLSVNTVSRWEQGRFRPKGKAVIAFLKDTLDFTQAELDRLFLEWVVRDARSTAPRIEDVSFLNSTGMSYHALLDRLLEIDHATIPHLSNEDAGNAAHWATIFEAQPHGWRVLVQGNQIIGNWHFLHLKRPAFEAAKAGQLREGSIRLTDLADWTEAYSGQPANLLISALNVDVPFQHPTNGMLLIRSLFSEITRLITDGFAVSEICTVAHSPNALHLCKSLGMKRVGKQVGYSSDVVADVYAAQAASLTKAPLFRRLTNLPKDFRKQQRGH